MGDEERRRFMMEGTRTGKLATVRPDASPHVAPIWFVLDGDDVVLMTGSRTPRGATCAATPAPRWWSTMSSRPSPTCGWTARPS